MFGLSNCSIHAVRLSLENADCFLGKVLYSKHMNDCIEYTLIKLIIKIYCLQSVLKSQIEIPFYSHVPLFNAIGVVLISGPKVRRRLQPSTVQTLCGADALKMRQIPKSRPLGNRI